MSVASARCLVVTADDFGSSVMGVERIVRSHVAGVLTSASLMVAATGAEAAVCAAREHLSLAVGLHLTLCDGAAALAHAVAPQLVDARGMLRPGPASAGIAYAFRHPLRRQMRDEVAEQFARFEATGLPCDHIDGHHHLHVHPIAWRESLTRAREIGAAAIRVPREPLDIVDWRAPAAAIDSALLRTISAWCARSATRAGLQVADRVLGIAQSGTITESRLLSLLDRVRDGVTEIYMHPGDHEMEVQALCAPSVREEMLRRGLVRAPWRGIPCRSG